jgi:hypothetical protein
MEATQSAETAVERQELGNEEGDLGMNIWLYDAASS